VSDRLALEAVFQSCGGAGWNAKDGWMTDAGLGEWYGVTVDAEGRVTELELARNTWQGLSRLSFSSWLFNYDYYDQQLSAVVGPGGTPCPPARAQPGVRFCLLVCGGESGSGS
jgi:hypothetical protein